MISYNIAFVSKSLRILNCLQKSACNYTDKVNRSSFSYYSTFTVL